MQTIEITTAQYNLICKSNNLTQIVEDNPILVLFQLGKKTYVPTGGCSDYREAYEVIPLELYEGDLQPLCYSAHFVEVNTNLRQRSYTGMKIKYRNQSLVCLEEVRFVKAEKEVKQASLF